MLTVHLSQLRKVGEVPRTTLMYVTALVPRLRQQLLNLTSVIQKMVAGGGVANLVTYAKLTLTVHLCSKVGGVWSRYS